MTDQNQQELLEALAGQLHVATEGYKLELPGIPIGDGPPDQIPYVDTVDFREGRKWALVRLTNGETWLLRVDKLGAKQYHEVNLGHTEVISSHYRYQALYRQWLVVLKTAQCAGMDTDLMAQTYHDDILGEDERYHWDRWTSCGTANAAEWEVVTGSLDG